MMGLMLLLAQTAATPSAPREFSVHDTRLMIDDYGRCVVRRKHDSVATAISRNLDNADLMKYYPELIDGRCMDGPPLARKTRVRFQGDEFRYALADALVRNDLASAPPPAVATIPPLDHRDPTPPSRVDEKGRAVSDRYYQQALDAYQRDAAFSYASRLGECIVRANSSEARDLLATKPESPAETSSFVAMGDALTSCVDNGEKLSLNKLVLRGIVAVNYYRLVTAARGLPVAGAAH